MKLPFSLLAIFVLGLALAGCTGSDKPKDNKTKEYDFKGAVTAIDLKKLAVTIDHEDIPGLMNAMEMEFRVENPKLLDGLKKGNKVKGRVRKDETGLTITHLEK